MRRKKLKKKKKKKKDAIEKIWSSTDWDINKHLASRRRGSR